MGKRKKRKDKFDIREMDADHVMAGSKRGRKLGGNCQMLRTIHNRAKGTDKRRLRPGKPFTP